jgi:hypothetical protein
MTIKKKAPELNGWTKSTRSKRLGSLFFILVLFSGVYLSLPPVAHAADSNPVDPDLLKRTLSDLNDIIGVDMEQYTITQSCQREDINILQVVQQVVDLHLTSDSSTVRITVNYANNKLMMVYVSDLQGNLKMRVPADTPFIMATSMLSRYQKLTDNDEYGAIANGSFRNIQLKTTTPNSETTDFMWVYCNDGAIADRKNICISYEYGNLKYFMNNWAIYTIANTTNNFNETQAQLIALKFMKHYYYNYTLDNGTIEKVSNFSIVNSSYLGHTYLIYINAASADNARGGDQTVFYPAWVVPMGFDRWYPGGVSMIQVILWADTGQICSPAFNYNENDTNNVVNYNENITNNSTNYNENDTNNPSQPWITQTVCIAATICAVVVGCAVLAVCFKRFRVPKQQGASSRNFARR